ncbi:unnamed protein product [Rotaria sordida]|uniref:Uncharacterized protein n=1 Tax=Rotaria sordida TaxID=392033 RepID=A0A814XZJ7_9BILA|nr:unnamed protein product [Rotaria sordida]CAF1098481.1 unnamed protein product [Rotaria sordida]CAF1177497.1 unnamed protein product [Rotaria sordida]CAF1223078.1 unnamed protein product [Rotaria sordida]CAF1237588.1 unnamed protein product [Rotaria sordida]
MSIKSTDDILQNLKEIDKNDQLLNKNNYLFQSFNSYKSRNNHQSPIEQQNFRSCQTFISILISLFFLISITIIVYQISKYFIHENYSKKTKINCKNTNDTYTK